MKRIQEMGASLALVAALAAQAGATGSTRVDPAHGYSYPTNVTLDHYRSGLVKGFIGHHGSSGGGMFAHQPLPGSAKGTYSSSTPGFGMVNRPEGGGGTQHNTTPGFGIVSRPEGGGGLYRNSTPGFGIVGRPEGGGGLYRNSTPGFGHIPGPGQLPSGSDRSVPIVAWEHTREGQAALAHNRVAQSFEAMIKSNNLGARADKVRFFPFNPTGRPNLTEVGKVGVPGINSMPITGANYPGGKALALFGKRGPIVLEGAFIPAFERLAGRRGGIMFRPSEQGRLPDGRAYVRFGSQALVADTGSVNLVKAESLGLAQD